MKCRELAMPLRKNWERHVQVSVRLANGSRGVVYQLK